MEEMDVIDRFLETFITYIDSGFGLLAGDVAYLTTTLIAIDITLAGLFWALSENSDVIAGLIRKVLYVGFFAYIIGNFQLLSAILFESFAALGIKAGSGTLTAEDLLRPGYIAGVGFEAALPLLDEAGSLLGPIAFFHNFVLISVLLIAWAIIIAAFFILAVQLFIAVLEFKLTTLAGFILVPFALWNRTAFLAERVLGNVITSGMKLMVLAIIIGIGSTLFTAVTDAFTGGDDLTLADVMGTVLAATVFLWMGIFGPGIASGLVSGAPQLGAGSAAGASAAVGAAALLAGSGAAAAARGVPAGVRAGASLAGGARTAYDLGRMGSGASGLRGAAAGMGAAALAGAGLIGRAAGRPFAGTGAAWQAGSRAAFEATGGRGAGSGEPPGADDRPAWARRLTAGQRLGQAATLAAHTLRDGDRAMQGAAPDLKQKEE
ncbi:MAG: P-type conjugative transfer protein TrbL [Hyphomonas sp.]|uniref:P-type conjugative transfer protein TrbL n=1 Tax=Hyphomonas sp. TaxID=87 RepID=UPI0025BDEF5F|nr:P-type conjugative transfer protein TrbL [Hyphomonas sp.]MBA4338943.1 P-type conjugative transfer protein TrbL [Hyphomonas sp.]